MNIPAIIIGFIIGLLPRRWCNWVLSTVATGFIVLVSFFVDALNTPSDPTFEQYTGHSSRTSLLLALGAVWVLGTLALTIWLSIAARPHYVPFPAPVGDVVETTATEQPAWVTEPVVDDDPDAEYKILREASDKLDALRNRQS